jgi:hypothetical protein
LILPSSEKFSVVISKNSQRSLRRHKRHQEKRQKKYKIQKSIMGEKDEG